MPTIETTKNKQGKYHPVIGCLTLSNGEFIAGEAIVSITGTNEESVKEVASLFIQEIIHQLEDDRNYGLLFYACGYDGKAQQELEERMFEQYGVRVF